MQWECLLDVDQTLVEELVEHAVGIFLVGDHHFEQLAGGVFVTLGSSGIRLIVGDKAVGFRGEGYTACGIGRFHPLKIRHKGLKP